jgi:hypothetical protein
VGRDIGVAFLNGKQCAAPFAEYQVAVAMRLEHGVESSVLIVLGAHGKS